MANSEMVSAQRVMLVAKYPVLRQGLREIVEREGDLTVVAEARDAAEAVVAARALQPDVVVLEASLAWEGGGIEALRRCRGRRRPARVICIGLSCDREHVLHALRAGACGFVRTEDAAEELVAALRLACPDRPFLGGAVDREDILSALMAMGSRASLLVIEEEAETAEAVRSALEAAGYEVLLASSSREGLGLVEAQRPDGIILEVKVPAGAEEYQFVWELRKNADSQIRNTPVLALTSVNREADGEAVGEEAGAPWEPYEYLPVQDFIGRPVRPKLLVEKVRSLVGARGK
jgi:DNA-binding NarL/FixJ family response regulator